MDEKISSPTNDKNQEKKEIKEKPLNLLEIGAGSFPFVDRDKLEEGDNYYIVEVDENKLEVLKKFLEIEREKKRDKIKGNVYTILADAQNLPFENEKMDKIFFSNVFGDPQLTEKVKMKMLEESRRILKESGELIIKEDITPPNVESLINSIEKLNFVLIKKIDTLSGWQKEIAKYHSGRSANFYPNAYLLYFKKIALEN